MEHKIFAISMGYYNPFRNHNSILVIVSKFAYFINFQNECKKSNYDFEKHEKYLRENHIFDVKFLLFYFSIFTSGQIKKHLHACIRFEI